MNLSEAVESSSKSSKGRCCLFVQLSPTEGVKFYHTEEMRDKAAESQRRASVLGLGPKVGEFCEMPALQSWEWPHRWPESTNTVYGYITQVAEIRELTPEEFDYLTESLVFHRFDIADLAENFNVGIVDGLPVCIDFDPIGVA